MNPTPIPTTPEIAADYHSAEALFRSLTGRKAVAGDQMVCKDHLSGDLHLFIRTGKPDCWRGIALQGALAIEWPLPLQAEKAE